MQVRLMDKMGSDLTVVNAARVSFAKESGWDIIPEGGETEGILNQSDEKLIKYLEDTLMMSQSFIFLKDGDYVQREA